MKKLLLCSVLAAFASVTALQAGEAKPCDQAKASCSEQAKSSCCSKALAMKKKTDMEVKGATLLVKR